MEYDLEIPFDELGLETETGWLIGYFDGVANIAFDDDGDWEITGVTVENRKLVDGKWQTGHHVFHCRTHADGQLYALICTAIEKSYSARIEQEVSDELDKLEALNRRPDWLYANSAGRTM